jgi:hypothetical protein
MHYAASKMNETELLARANFDVEVLESIPVEPLYSSREPNVNQKLETGVQLAIKFANTWSSGIVFREGIANFQVKVWSV